MKKLWSFFWLVVASCIAFSIMASILAPYMWLVVVFLLVGVIGVIGFKVWRFVQKGRGRSW